MFYFFTVQRAPNWEAVTWYFEDEATAQTARMAAALATGAGVGALQHDYMTDLDEFRRWLAEPVDVVGMAGISSATVELPAPGLVDGVEIAGCVEAMDYAERVDGATPADFWTVYWHRTEGGADAVEDFSTAEDARIFARAIAARYGLEPDAIHDYT